MTFEHWNTVRYLKTLHPDSLVRICNPDQPNELGVGVCKLSDLLDMLPHTMVANRAELGIDN